MARRKPSSRGVLEVLESRVLLSGAFETIQLDDLRADPLYASVDGSGVGIAVLDTGIFWNHPDLRDNVVAWYDAVTRTSMTAPFDPNGHGSHVAGTAASSDPEIGVAHRARIIAVRALPDQGEARPRHDTVAEALHWVLGSYEQYDIRVVNMSLGTQANINTQAGSGDVCDSLIDALERAGITVVTASGNSYADYGAPGAASPAVYSTLSVASVWEDNGVGDQFPLFAGGGGPFAAFEREGRRDRFAASSQRSSLPNQVAAPGQTIFSTWNGVGGQFYQTISGTSMASPIVAGLVALMQDAASTFGGRYLSPAEVVSLVRSSADMLTDSNVASNGRLTTNNGVTSDLPETGISIPRVNAYRAVQAVRTLVMRSGEFQAPASDIDRRLQHATNLGFTDGTFFLSEFGIVGTDGTFQPGNDDIDLFRFETASVGTILIDLYPVDGEQEVDTHLRLFNQNGVLIDENDDVSEFDLYSSLVTEILPAGVYYVGVSASGNSSYSPLDGSGATPGLGVGHYSIDVLLDNPDPNGVAGGAVPFEGLPSLFTGEIGTDGGRFVGGQDVDFFRIVAPDDGVLIVDIDSGDFGFDAADSVVWVLSESLAPLAFNDDEVSGNLDPRVEVALQRGQVVYVAIADYDNFDFDPLDPYNRNPTALGGFYEAFMYFDNGDADGSVFLASPGVLGSTVAGQVGTDSGVGLIGNDGTQDVDFVEYTMTRAGVFEVTVTSPDASLQPSVRVWTYDAESDDVVVVAEDAAPDAVTLRLRVLAGQTYYVSVSGLGNSDYSWYSPATGLGGDTGGYQLRTVLRRANYWKRVNDDSINNGRPAAIDLGSQVFGYIGEDSGFVSGSTDTDLYKFVAPSDQSVVVRTLASLDSSSDTVLRVYDANGILLALNDDAGDGTTASQLSLSVVAGQAYYLAVSGFPGEIGSYNIINGAGAQPGSVGDYSLIVSPAGKPEIEVRGNGRIILAGDTMASQSHGTHAGLVPVAGGMAVLSFTIYNNGPARLRLGSPGVGRVVISGQAGADFRVLSTAPARIRAWGSLTFQVEFDPSQLGDRFATLTINNNDLNESIFSFDIAGIGG